MNWRPRSSKVGGYFSCSARVAYDRFSPAESDEASPYADLGTLIHWRLMSHAMNLKFPDGKEPPTSNQLSNAETLFSSPSACEERIAAVAAYAAERVPPTPAGHEWLAETHYETDVLTGSIDFISSDGSVIGDLKTTSKPPPGGKLKPAHLYQLMCYAILAESAGAKPREAWVLYIGSLKDFDCLVKFPLDTVGTLKLKDDIRRSIDFWRDEAALRKYAARNIGPHCRDDFCPHRARCCDLISPAPGESLSAAASRVVIANPFARIP